MSVKPKRTPAKTAGKKAAPKVKNVPAKKPPAAKPPAPAPVRIGPMPQVLRGFRDILPSEQRYWHFIRRRVENLGAAYGYERIDTPMLEETSLFVRSVGRQTDIVEKEMFTFEDRGGDSVSLRPEGTAPVARAYVNHGMLSLPQPVKLYYIGPMFRYERPQAGRFRQHHQFGFEVFGDGNPVIDAEVILLSYLFYKEIGIKTIVHINSLGCPNCRPVYSEQLVNYFRARRAKLCEDCRRRLVRNPLRLLDCKDPNCLTLRESVPHIVDYLDEGCKDHLMRVLEFLDELQVPYVLDPHLVRGIDYYGRTVFELMPADESQAGGHALCGGGRYDRLVEQLGGRPTPACGFGIGIERAILEMKRLGVEPKDEMKPEVFLAQLGDSARRKAFTLFEELRAGDLRVAASFSRSALKNQLETSNRLGAKLTVIIGQKEVLDGTVLVRDMESGMQEVIAYDKAVAGIRKKLGRT